MVVILHEKKGLFSCSSSGTRSLAGGNVTAKVRRESRVANAAHTNSPELPGIVAPPADLPLKQQSSLPPPLANQDTT
jgi:hypothetical protein